MTWEELDGWWTDAGTFESLLRASNLVAETGANKMELQRPANVMLKFEDSRILVAHITSSFGNICVRVFVVSISNY